FTLKRSYFIFKSIAHSTLLSNLYIFAVSKTNNSLKNSKGSFSNFIISSSLVVTSFTSVASKERISTGAEGCSALIFLGISHQCLHHIMFLMLTLHKKIIPLQSY
ncbi:MAG: hypothetical protein LBC61_04760, partial [Candidatus Peribacteria bacterium]|nr:hypothetical protein [Candidatus Peribacteria bacterium]